MSTTSVNEEVLAQTYLIDYLSSDSSLMNLVNGVSGRSAWASLKPPYVKVARLDAADLFVIGPKRIWADLTYLVRGIDQWTGQDLPDWGPVQEIANRLDQLLQAHEVVTADLELHSFREESFTDETVESGDLYLHAGGIYRVRAHAL